MVLSSIFIPNVLLLSILTPIPFTISVLETIPPIVVPFSIVATFTKSIRYATDIPITVGIK